MPKIEAYNKYTPKKFQETLKPKNFVVINPFYTYSETFLEEASAKIIRICLFQYFRRK